MSARAGSAAGHDFHWTSSVPSHVLEFKTYRLPINGISTAWFPEAPGAVVRNGLGRCAILHIAPGRWLIPEPASEMLTLLDAVTSGGAGAQIDVSGKWHALTLRGRDALRILAATVEPEEVLNGRQCAQVTLFDCPSIIARTDGGFDVWVQASYATALIASLERVSSPQRPGQQAPP
jgi:sarcosine oxidase gamma subunit